MAVLALTACGSSSTHSDRITSFDIAADLDASGTLTVSESITYDFGPEPSAGLSRDIPITAGDGLLMRRALDIDLVSVDSPTGAPVDIEREEETHGLLRLEIGDSANKVTGEQTYTITYTVDGILTGEAERDGVEVAEHAELYWNFIGTDWGVPIDDVEIVLDAPAISDVRCYAGEEDTQGSCESVAAATDSVTITEPSLRSGEGVTALVELPPPSVEVAEPSHRLRPLPPWLTWSGLAGVLAALAFFVGWMWLMSSLRSRLDRGRPPVDVTRMSPGATGLLTARERIRPAHLLAMLVELEDRDVVASWQHPEKPDDWIFHLNAPHDPHLTPAQSVLISGMFRNGPTVDLSTLGRSLTTRTVRSIRASLLRELRGAGFLHGPIASTVGALLGAVLFFAAFMVPAWIVDTIAFPLEGMHIAALIIVALSIWISVVSVLPIGATRAGARARNAVKSLTGTQVSPAYLIAAGRPEALAAVQHAQRHFSNHTFRSRWDSTLHHHTRNANPSSSSGGSGGGRVGGGGGGGGGGRR